MCKLALIQFGIEAVLGKQFLVLALLHDVAVPHDEDPVRFPDGGQAVGDDKAGAPAHHGVERLLNLDLRPGIDGGSRLVQKQHGRQAQHHPGNAQQLLLSLRKAAAGLADNGIIPLRQTHDEAVGVRLLRGGDTVLLDIPCGWRGYHTDKSITFYFGDLDENPKADLIRAAHEQCIALEKMTAELLRPGAVPAEIYEKILAAVDPAFRDGFMNSCKFLGHSIGLTMDEAPVLAKGFNDPVVPGMTFAVEPKIALEGIGLIGTENTYEVTEDSAAKSLTGDCETGLEINY